MKLVVIVPAFNEQDNIGRVLLRIPRKIGGIDEIVTIVIDDGSQDETAKIAKASGADFVIKHPTNLGVARAFMTGVRAAKKNNASILVNIDADGQFNPAEIPKIVSPILDKRADVVLGSRFIGRSQRTIPLIKRIGNLIISLLVSILSGHRIRDTQCGFRALSRRAMNNLNLSGLFTYTQEMILNLSFERMVIIEVPITVRYFHNRRSRVVKSIPKYTLQVLGIIMISMIRQIRAALGTAFFFVVSLFAFYSLFLLYI